MPIDEEKLNIATMDASILNNTLQTPIAIDTNTIISNCNVRCKLDVANLEKKPTSTTSTTSTTSVIINNINEGIPHICIKMFEHKYTIKYNGLEYLLHKIIIFDDYLHDNVDSPRPRGSGFETILYFLKQGNDDGVVPLKLCISLNTVKDEFGSDFFEQLFGILGKKIPQAQMLLNIKSDTSGIVTYKAQLSNNWSPKMIIPKTQTYYKYTGTWPFNENSKDPTFNESSKDHRCTWILYLDKIEISTDMYEIIKKLIPAHVPKSHNWPPISNHAGKHIVYKHIDTKNNKLNEDDLVIKCEKENDENDCDAGDIEYQKAQSELYDASSTCPTTISSKEINTLYKSYLTDFVPSASNVIIKIINVIIYTTALIFGYILAKFSMENFNGNILFQLGNLFWYAIQWVGKGIKSETAQKMAKGLRAHAPNPINAMRQIKGKKKFTSGGDLLTPQDKFINQYEINQLRH